MKAKKLLTVAMLCISAVLAAQSGEFNTSANGLIYSDNAVKELKHIVDSLNLKFKICENKEYRSVMQGRGRFFRVGGRKAAEVKKDIEAGKSYTDLVKKYKDATTGEHLIVRYTYIDYEDREVTMFEPIRMDGKGGFDVSYTGDEAKKMQGKVEGWIMKYTPENEYTSESITAYYFDKGMSSPALKDKYARQVQYSECLVDTTAQVYFRNATNSGVRYGYASDSTKLGEFTAYLSEKMGKPQYPYSEEELYSIAVDTASVDTTATVVDDSRFALYRQQLVRWESLRLQKVDSLMKHDGYLASLYHQALDEAVRNPGSTSDEFEEYVARYTSGEQALFFKRSRRVIGGCSMDNSPRIHAMEIAELAAETASWEVFLRSHLDIMNDRFDRVSDGSYAWAGRQTYIRELEVLDINVPDLLLGITLRVENPSENHYFGSIGRMGRSLSESQEKAVVEKMMLDMIADNELDDFNRVLAFWLFRNYNAYTENKAEQIQKTKKLKEAVATMPSYLASYAVFED